MFANKTLRRTVLCSIAVMGIVALPGEDAKAAGWWFGGDSYDGVLMFVMEGSTSTNQLEEPATTDVGGANPPSLVTIDYAKFEDYLSDVVGMSSAEAVEFEQDMRDSMQERWGFTVTPFDPTTGSAAVFDAEGGFVGVTVTQYVKPEIGYRPYWIQGLPRRKLRGAETLDFGYVTFVTTDAAAGGLNDGNTVVAGSAIAYGRYVLRGVGRFNDIDIDFYSTRPIAPGTTHLECEIESDFFGLGQALLPNPSALAEELDPVTHETRFVTRNVLTFPARLD